MVERVRKVRITPEGGLAVTVDEEDGQVWRTLEVTSQDEPSPKLATALDEIPALLMPVLELAPEYGETCEFRALAVRVDGITKGGMVVTVTRGIEVSNSPFVLNSPLLRPTDDHPMDDLVDGVLEAVALALKFARGGERAQIELFEGDDAKAGDGDVEPTPEVHPDATVAGSIPF